MLVLDCGKTICLALVMCCVTQEKKVNPGNNQPTHHSQNRHQRQGVLFWPLLCVLEE